MIAKKVPKEDFDVSLLLTKREADLIFQIFRQSPSNLSDLIDNYMSGEYIANLTNHGMNNSIYAQLKEILKQEA